MFIKEYGAYESFPYQTDPAFSKAHNEYGCYVQTISHIAWKKGGFDGVDLREEIQRRVDTLLAKGYIDEEFTVMDPNAVFYTFGLRVRYTDKWEDASRPLQSDEVQALRMGYKSMKHFVEGGRNNRVLWDPWSATGSLTARHGIVLDKRVFKVLGRV